MNTNKKKDIEKTKTEFFAVAAHELRAPLSIMRWNLEMLINGDFGQLPEEAKKALNRAYTSNLDMITLIQKILSKGFKFPKLNL